jgi:murein DD-endopeptidase MepM/ murein hydrolase activator NlpD
MISGMKGLMTRETGTVTRDSKLKKAITDFEAIFINQMLKSMRSTIVKSGLIGDSNSEKIYTSLIDAELSKFIAEDSGIGLYKVLSSQLVVEHDEADEANEAKAPPVTPWLRERLEEIGRLRFPTSGRISSGFGMRKDPLRGGMMFHHGIDIAAREGELVFPVSDGEVIFSGKKDGYGNVVEVRHSNGYVTRYAHNSGNVVKPGDSVRTGEPIARVGTSGRSTGPHLHFEVLKDGVRLDPARFFYG